MKREPSLATWLLKLFCSSVEYESVTGDLLEQYQTGRGDSWYYRQVLDIVCRSVVRKRRIAMRQNLGLHFVFLLWTFGLVFSDSGLIGAFFFVAFLGGVFAFAWMQYWHKDHPLKFQRLDLKGK